MKEEVIGDLTEATTNRNHEPSPSPLGSLKFARVTRFLGGGGSEWGISGFLGVKELRRILCLQPGEPHPTLHSSYSSPAVSCCQRSRRILIRRLVLIRAFFTTRKREHHTHTSNDTQSVVDAILVPFIFIKKTKRTWRLLLSEKTQFVCVKKTTTLNLLSRIYIHKSLS